MSRNRGRDTKPELLLRRALWHRGFRYRVRTNLPGKPDVVFSRLKIVIFVDGCFWHRCPEHGAKPKTNASFWSDKLKRNKVRDAEVTALLEAEGWTVVRIWEHEIKQDLAAALARVKNLLEQQQRI